MISPGQVGSAPLYLVLVGAGGYLGNCSTCAGKTVMVVAPDAQAGTNLILPPLSGTSQVLNCPPVVPAFPTYRLAYLPALHHDPKCLINPYSPLERVESLGVGRKQGYRNDNVKSAPAPLGKHLTRHGRLGKGERRQGSYWMRRKTTFVVAWTSMPIPPPHSRSA